MQDRDAWGHIYKVNETEVFVRNRPRSLEVDCTNFKSEDIADAYLSVTDTWVKPPEGKPLVWMPWNEGRKPTSELFYAVNRSLIYWIHYRKLKSVHLFCDAGTHRSVTVFGAFLLTYFPEDARNIVMQRKYVTRGDDEGSPTWADPLEYIESYLKEFPEDYLLFKVMGNNYIGRLEEQTGSIYERVRKRFGREQ